MTSRRIVASVVMIGLLVGCRGICLGQQQATNPVREEPRYKCDTDGIRLQGTLIERTFYGPPGFGETPAQDAREKVFVLKLLYPITVEPTEEAQAKDSTSLETFARVRKVQLFVARTKTAEARKMLGRTVTAIGVLREAVAPSEHVDVVMDVKTLSPK